MQLTLKITTKYSPLYLLFGGIPKIPNEIDTLSEHHKEYELCEDFVNRSIVSEINKRKVNSIV